MPDPTITSVSIVTLVSAFMYLIACLLALLAWMAWRRRQQTQHTAIVVLLLLSATFYSFGYAGEVAQTTLAGAQFWLHVEYLGTPWAPALWAILARKHNGLKGRVWPLLIAPAITFLAEQTNSWHGLYDRHMELVYRAPFWVVKVDRGPIAWAFLIFLFWALAYGTWIYASRFHTSSRLLRKQSWLLSTSALPPLLGYLPYLFNCSPWGLDTSPLMLSVSVVIAFFAILWMGYLDLVPMARQLVFNNMRDAAVITDMEHRLVAYNPAAKKILPSVDSTLIGKNIAHSFPEALAMEALTQDPNTPQKLALSIAGEQQHFEVRIFPLTSDERQLGWTVIWADITAQVQLVHELRRDAETDVVTGVANRRAFETASKRELSRALRAQSPFAVLLVDIDRFKQINDKFGHGAGDHVLEAVAERAHICLRKQDLLCRYGGDEFAVLLPGTGGDGAREVGERIRAAVASQPMLCLGQPAKVTISVGGAAVDPAPGIELAEVLALADGALYKAKAGGRNRVNIKSGGVTAESEPCL